MRLSQILEIQFFSQFYNTGCWSNIKRPGTLALGFERVTYLSISEWFSFYWYDATENKNNLLKTDYFAFLIYLFLLSVNHN